MMRFSHGLSLAVATLGQSALALSACAPQEHPGFYMSYILNDEIGGLYYIDIAVGTPPQRQRVALDSATSDLALHSTADHTYLATCAEQTPISTCFSTYNNATSTSYKEVGHGDYSPVLGGQAGLGSYVEDIVTLGPAQIKGQILASTWNSQLPISILGLAPPKDEFSVSTDSGSVGADGRYKAVLQNLASQGFIQSPSVALWLDPTSKDPEDFYGRIDFGAIDELLFYGTPVTLPITKNTTVALDADPFTWNVALGSVALATQPDDNSIEGRPVSCTMDYGTTYFSFNNASFTKMAKKFPLAVANHSLPGITFYEMPCEERYNKANDLIFSLINPQNTSIHFDFTVPADQVIWPANLLFPSLNANTCVINALAWEEAYAGSTLEEKYECVIGSAALKSVYTIFHLDQLEISLAKPVPKTTQSRYRSIPEAGVPSMFD